MTEEKKSNNYAFIDGQNLHSGVRAAGWKLDHKKFRQYLQEAWGVDKAYIFIGFMEEQQDLYNVLQDAGFILFFKPLVRYDDGSIKGNVDAELILQAMIDKENYNQAVIVSGDGDFTSLIRYLAGENKLKQIIIPNKHNYSSLYKRLDSFDEQNVTFIGGLKKQLAYGNSANPTRRKVASNKRSNSSQKPRSNSSRRSNSPRSGVKSGSARAKNANTNKRRQNSTTTRNTDFKPKAQVEEDLLNTIMESNRGN